MLHQEAVRKNLLEKEIVDRICVLNRLSFEYVFSVIILCLFLL